MNGQAKPLGWGHINLNVDDLERSIEFYQWLGFDVFIPGIPYLGLERDSAAELDEASANALGVKAGVTGRACIMQLDDGFPKLDLTELTGTTPREPLTTNDRGLVRLCLASADLQADHARLSALGVEFLSPPRACRDGLADIAVCADPDGTLIELIQIYPEKWAAILG